MLDLNLICAPLPSSTQLITAAHFRLPHLIPPQPKLLPNSDRQRTATLLPLNIQHMHSFEDVWTVSRQWISRPDVLIARFHQASIAKSPPFRHLTTESSFRFSFACRADGDEGMSRKNGIERCLKAAVDAKALRPKGVLESVA